VRQLRPLLDRAGWMPHYGLHSNQVKRMKFGIFHEFWSSQTGGVVAR